MKKNSLRVCVFVWRTSKNHLNVFFFENKSISRGLPMRVTRIPIPFRQGPFAGASRGENSLSGSKELPG
jgi:hypothetical protein